MSASNDASRIGGEFALSAICRLFGKDVFVRLPDIYERSVAALEQMTEGV